MEIVAAMTSASMKDWLISGIGTIGLAWYYFCIVNMGVAPTPNATQATGFRQFQSLSVTTISVSLATYVGYIIGLPASTVATHSVGGTGTAGTAVPAGAAVSVGAPVASNVTGMVSPLQLSSAVLYVLSLVIAVYFYWRTKDQTEPALTGLAKSLLGFVAGVFSVALNLPA